MKEAFKKAGWHDPRNDWPSKEFLALAAGIMVKYAKNSSAAALALLRACGDDAALLKQLVEPVYDLAADRIFSEVRAVNYRQSAVDDKRARGKQQPTHHVLAAAPIVELEREQEASRATKLREEREAAKAISLRNYQEWRDTLAAEFTINGRRFWQVSVHEAREWQQSQGRRVKFVDLLLTGLPDDDRPISYYRRPDEVDGLWKQAQQ